MLSNLTSYLASNIPELPEDTEYKIVEGDGNFQIILSGPSIDELMRIILDQVDRDAEHVVVMDKIRVISTVISQDDTSVIVELKEL